MRAFRPDVEGLRAVAILLVVAFHARVGCVGGFIGVDVFFVLSGYLITGLLVAEHEVSGRIDLARFYARRARRLLPAVTVMVTVCLVVGALVLSPLEQRHLANSAAATAAYASNAWFSHSSTEYFVPGHEIPVLLHTWSLAVEEQFYFAWPLIVLLALKGATTSKRRLMITLGCGTVVSLVACAWLTQVNQPAAFFGTPTRAWEFGAGALASMLPADAFARVGSPWRDRARVLGWIGLVVLVVGAFTLPGDYAFPGLRALLPVCSTVAVLLAGVAAPTSGASALVSRGPFLVLGRLSYSWYLWHWPALAMLDAFVTDAPIVARVLVVSGALIVAALSAKFVEGPIRFNKALAARPRTSIALGLSLSAAVALSALGIAHRARVEANTPLQLAINAAATTSNELEQQGCLAGLTVTEPHECILGSADSLTTIVLFGDSHASQWVPALSKLAKRNHWRVVVLMKFSCPPADVPVFNHRLRREFSECLVFREAALRRVEALHPAAVLLGSFSGREAKGRDWLGRDILLAPGEWRDGMRRTVTRIAATGAAALVMRDTPAPMFEVPTCLERVARRRSIQSTDCSFPRDRADAPMAASEEREAVVGIRNAAVIDLFDELCPDSTCRAMRGDTVLYRDINHLSVRAAEELGDRLGELLRPRLGEISR
ncbi:MAG: acyltransferase family protein [Polyangiales bacterium]